MLPLQKTGTQLLLLITLLAQIAAGDCAWVSGGLDHKPAIQPLAPLTNNLSDSKLPCHLLPRTSQISNKCLSTSSLHPHSLNARQGILSHQQSHTINKALSDGYKPHLTWEPHLLLQKEPSPELGSPTTSEVALLPLWGPIWMPFTEETGTLRCQGLPLRPNESGSSHPASTQPFVSLPPAHPQALFRLLQTIKNRS